MVPSIKIDTVYKSLISLGFKRTQFSFYISEWFFITTLNKKLKKIVQYAKFDINTLCTVS